MFRNVCILAILSSAGMGQYIEATFPAPCGNITGLTCHWSGVLVIDGTELNLYRIDHATGEVYSTVSLPGFVNYPVGLGVMDSTVYFAESGTALVYSMKLDGTYLETWNFADSGLVSITGIDFMGDDDLFLIDESDRSVYRLEIPMGIQPMYKMFTISDDIEVYDIGWDVEGVPVACNDPVSPVRFYWDDDDYTPLGTGTYMSASGVGVSWDGRIYFSDPMMNAIHRYCPNMGGTGGEEEARTEGLGLRIADNPVASGLASIIITCENPTILGFSVFNLLGRMVLDIPEQRYERGINTVSIQSILPGIYICLLNGGDFQESIRFIVTE